MANFSFLQRMHDASALTSRWDTNKSLPGMFERAVRGFKRTIKGLQDDIELLRSNALLRKMDKVKIIWNEDGMKEHHGQLKAQSSASQLLSLVLQTYAHLLYTLPSSSFALNLCLKGS